MVKATLPNYCNARLQCTAVHSHVQQAQCGCLQVPSPVALVVGGSWKGHLAGGRLPQPTWPSNPQFMIAAQQRAEVMVVLVRTDGASANAMDGPHDPQAAIGLVAVEVLYSRPCLCANLQNAARLSNLPAQLVRVHGHSLLYIFYRQSTSSSGYRCSVFAARRG